MQKINFSKSKLVDIGELKGTSIDITCKTRENVLELYELFKEVDFIYNLSLYEIENINLLVGWILIPLTNEVIQKNIEMNYGKVLKITDKTYKDGLKSGMRINAKMQNRIEANTKLYQNRRLRTMHYLHSGQQITCKYCGNKEHVQSNFQKRLQDFADLTNDQNHSKIFKSTSIENSQTSVDNAKLPKKRKLALDLNDSKSNF